MMFQSGTVARGTRAYCYRTMARSYNVARGTKENEEPACWRALLISDLKFVSPCRHELPLCVYIYRTRLQSRIHRCRLGLHRLSCCHRGHIVHRTRRNRRTLRRQLEQPTKRTASSLRHSLGIRTSARYRKRDCLATRLLDVRSVKGKAVDQVRAGGHRCVHDRSGLFWVMSFSTHRVRHDIPGHARRAAFTVIPELWVDGVTLGGELLFRNAELQ